MSSKEISSYGKVFHLHHREAQALLNEQVVVQEKVDGSQFSFGVVNGQFFARSRNQMLVEGNLNKLFATSFGTAKDLADAGKLKEGWTYRGEAFCKPKHNTLAYDNMPPGGILLYDVMREADGDWLDEHELEAHALELGLPKVPCYFEGTLRDLSDVRPYLSRVSCLGGQPIEGVVIKARHKYDGMGKMLRIKLVQDYFKELNQKDFKNRNPNQRDIIAQLSETYSAKARFHKALQHLLEDDNVEVKYELSDLQNLFPELVRDFEEECAEEIKDRLWDWAKKDLKRNISKGLPEWYKQYLFDRNNQPEEAG